ncbi:MAG: hypothetical protein WBM44_05425 [Waterburya sp.]
MSRKETRYKVSDPKKNKTNSDWLTEENLANTGTAVFLMPRNTLSRFGFGEQRYRGYRGHRRGYGRKVGFVKRSINNLSYEQAINYGTRALVFKWIPNSIASYQQLRSQPCGSLCVDTCVKPGCICYRGKCR